MKIFRIIFAIILCDKLNLAKGTLPRHEFTAEHWKNQGQSDLKNALNVFENLKVNKAKNVIIFLGDGMSLSTIVAGRILKGQRSEVNGVKGEETMTSLDQMPHLGLMKTYSVDNQTPDSAATATAYLSGVKTKSQMLGVTASAQSGNCPSIKGNEIESIIDYAAKAGKSTGVITTTRVQHATPAGSYANVPSRNWYSDKFLPTNARGGKCKDIALQLREAKFNVILGGGRVHMRPGGRQDEEYAGWAQRGDRLDRRDLVKEWIDEKPRGTAKYAWNKKQFDVIDPKSTDYLMGLFEPFEMRFALDNKRVRTMYKEPTLAEMTTKAIQILSKNNDGFVLLVEGGLIDKGHHRAKPQYALEEFLEFEKAVQAGQNLTSDSDTLIMVTADHGHVFNIGSGTPVRGNPILGLSPDNKRPKRAADGKYYTSISYGNGPGKRLFQSKLNEKNLADPNADTRLYQYQGTTPFSSESHSAEDVVALASGPMSHLVHGVHEQTYVAHVMMYASCLGPYNERCNQITDARRKLMKNDEATLMEEILNPAPFEEDI